MTRRAGEGVGARSTHGRDEKYIYKILFGKPEGKRLFGISRHICEDNIKTNVK